MSKLLTELDLSDITSYNSGCGVYGNVVGVCSGSGSGSGSLK